LIVRVTKYLLTYTLSNKGRHTLQRRPCYDKTDKKYILKPEIQFLLPRRSQDIRDLQAQGEKYKLSAIDSRWKSCYVLKNILFRFVSCLIVLLLNALLIDPAMQHTRVDTQASSGSD